MKVLLNALQAGNRSGTGVYTAQLAARMPSLAGEDRVRVVWPAALPRPKTPAGTGDAFLTRANADARSRIFYDQVGIRRDIRAEQIDVVHYPANVGSVLPLRNMVITIHDLTFFHNPSWYRFERVHYYRKAVAWSAARASRIIAVSKATADEVSKILAVPADRVDVVHNGVDERYAPRTQEEQLAVQGKYRLPNRYFLFVGTIEPRKNVARIIQSWSRIAHEVEEYLVIAGREGWKVGPIHLEAERSDFTSRILFPGFIDAEDLPAVMSGATALVYPSLYEGFGIPVAEAMACGVPVLTSNVSSLPEVAGDAALLVMPTSVDEMANAMLRLARDTALREEFAAKGLVRARQFNWTRAAEETLACYRRVLAS